MFIASKRTALDGKVWWCVWDTAENKWSTIILFGKYKLKRDCQYAIEKYNKLTTQKHINGGYYEKPTV